MIKDQCDYCKSSDSCTLNIVFDSTSCENYVRRIDLEKHKIDLEKHDSDNSVPQSGSLSDQVGNPVQPNGQEIPDNEEFDITSDYLKETTSIGGWLAFFLFTIVAGGLVSAIYPIATYNVTEYDDNTILAVGDVVFGLLLCALAFYTLYAFIQRKPDAVFLGKTYVVAVFASNLLSLFVGEFEPSGIGSFSQVIRGLTWGGFWFTYLCVSNQVEEVIPKEYRKLGNIDYYILTSLIVVPLLFLAVGLNNIQSNRQAEADTFIQETVLKEGERTDGRIVFSVPNTFKCEKTDAEGLTIYNLENEEIGSVTICSDYDGDQSASNINSYWINWEDDEAKPFPAEVVTNEKRTVNGHPYYYKVKKYKINGNTIYWRFAMLFDDASSKVCLLSCYDQGVDYYFDEIINTIRFR